MHELINGPAIIIDDMIGNETDVINDLIDEIENENIPCIKFNCLPDDAISDHLSGVSFIVLDWRLHVTEPGIELPDSVIGQSITFLKRIIRRVFVPIFIFTSENVDDIRDRLESEEVISENGPNVVFIENKASLLDGNLFTKITDWIEQSPAIYVLKKWELEYSKAKTELFVDFYSLSHSWPKVLWSNYSSDGADPSSSIGEVITNNLQTRITPFQLEAENLSNDMEVSRKEIRSVLFGEKFVSSKNNRIKENAIGTGDFFVHRHSEGGRLHYYINIRPDCDLIPRNGICIEEVKLYVLRMKKLRPKEEEKAFRAQYGNFDERETNCFIFNMFDDRSFSVDFSELHIFTWEDMAESRVGRLLPPYINRIQQKYSTFLQRMALPRVPEQAVIESSD